MDAFTIRIVSVSIVPSAEGALLTSFSARICGLYFNVIAVYVVSVQCLDSLISFGVAWHFNESNAFGLPENLSLIIFTLSISPNSTNRDFKVSSVVL
jgi:hypothetical protein